MKLTRRTLFSASLAGAGLASAARAGDWPQWRGPGRTGHSAETGWFARWSADRPPRVAWRARVGKGHSCLSVSGGRAYTMGWDGAVDTVFCLDAATGRVLWRHSYPCGTILQWPGPRSTPKVAGGAVYTLSQHGRLLALDAESGRALWSRQLETSYNPDVDYGFAWSPLAEGDLLILAAGTRGLALRRADGAFAWGNDGVHGACASPVPFDHEGRRVVAITTTDPGRESVRVVGVDPAAGKLLWRSEPWPEKWGAACVDPVIYGGSLFVTTAEQHQRGARFTIQGQGLRHDWSTRSLSGYTGGVIYWRDHLYGVNRLGRLVCLDWRSGEERWSQPGFDGFGSLIAADGHLLVQTGRRGDLVLAAADPAGYRELRRCRVFEGRPDTFTAPVLANGRIYCRSYEGEVVCLTLTW